MANITLFELHFEEGFDFAPSPEIGVSGEEGENQEYDVEDGSGGGRAVGALVGLVLLVILGIGVRKLMGDDLDPIEELDESVGS